MQKRQYLCQPERKTKMADICQIIRPRKKNFKGDSRRTNSVTEKNCGYYWRKIQHSKVLYGIKEKI